MKEITVNAACKHCGKDLAVKADIDPIMLAPDVRGQVSPIGSIFIYKITSEELKQFIIRKAMKYVPEIKCEIVPRYCEKKRKKETEPHHSYASFRIAFSDSCIDRKTDTSWYTQIGEADGNVRIVESLFKGIINKYSYDKKVISNWMKSYKLLEELEDSFGMTEAYLNDLKMYATPRLIQATNKENWVFFSAAPEKVISDYLTEVSTNTLPGRLEIKDVKSINKDMVEFVVYLYPGDIKLEENPHVRQILLGEEKAK